MYAARFFYYDFLRYIKYAGLYPSKDIAVIKRDLAFHVHCIEKGLTMPNFRFGFGFNKITKLVDTMLSYKSVSTETSTEYDSAINVLKEYVYVHQQVDFSLPVDIKTAIDKVLCNQLSQFSKQPVYSSNTFFSDVEKPFPIFSSSRHSVRNLIGAADVSRICAAVDLARNTPTACNRQFIRVHFVNNKIITQKILQFQSGSAGFGHTAEQCILITGDLRYMAWAGERNEIFLNAGIFCMNLSYALHYNKVAHCILNWQVHPGDSEKVRSLLNIGEEEEIAVMMICGKTPSDFKAPQSCRLPLTDILTIHEHLH